MLQGSGKNNISSMYLQAGGEAAETTKTPYQSLKIVVTFLQVLGSLQYTFTLTSIPWPSNFYKFMGQLNFIFQLSVLQIPNIGCFMQMSFYGEFFIFFVLPGFTLVFVEICAETSRVLRKIILKVAVKFIPCCQIKCCRNYLCCCCSLDADGDGDVDKDDFKGNGLVASSELIRRRSFTASIAALWIVYPMCVSRTLRMFNCRTLEKITI